MDAIIEADNPVVGGDRERRTAAIDILLTLGASGVLYALEMRLQSVGLLPQSGMYTGAITLVGTFVFVWWLVRWRGEGLAVLGLRRPPSWWFVTSQYQ